MAAWRQYCGEKTLLSSLPPSCSARPQITASSRRCPVGTWHPGEGRPAIPHLTGTHAYTHAHTHTHQMVVCVPVREWNMELHVHTQLLCMALYGCALHDVFVLHYYCVPVSWCCLSVSPWSQSALAGFIEATDSVGTHTHTHSHKLGAALIPG